MMCFKCKIKFQHFISFSIEHLLEINSIELLANFNMNFDNEFDIQNYLSIFLRNKLYDQWSVGNLSLFTVYLHLILLIAMKIYLKYIQIVY